MSIAATFPRGRVKVNPIIADGRASKMLDRGELLTARELWEFGRRVERDYHRGVPRVGISTPPAFHSLGFISGGHVSGGHCGFKQLLGILADGGVSFCGMGYRAKEYVFMRIGSGSSLDEVWNDHPVLREIRGLIPARLEGVCGNCVMKESCQGACRSEAYERYRSITAPSPACQELYEAGLFPISRLVAPARDCHYEPKSDAWAPATAARSKTSRSEAKGSEANVDQ